MTFKTCFSDLKHKTDDRTVKDAHFSVGTLWDQLGLADFSTACNNVSRKKHVSRITRMSDICNNIATRVPPCVGGRATVYAAASHQGHIGMLWTIDKLWYCLLVIKHYKTFFLILTLRDWPKSRDLNLEVQREHHVTHNPTGFTCQLINILTISPPKKIYLQSTKLQKSIGPPPQKGQNK